MKLAPFKVNRPCDTHIPRHALILSRAGLTLFAFHQSLKHRFSIDSIVRCRNPSWLQISPAEDLSITMSYFWAQSPFTVDHVSVAPLVSLFTAKSHTMYVFVSKSCFC